MKLTNTCKEKDFVKLSEEWFDHQAKVYDETDTILYSKYGKISCQNIYDYLSDKKYENLLDVGCGTAYLIGIGAIICVASIYVAVNMLVSENKSNISMLKVLGYRDKQINQIVLSVNHILLPIGFLLSIPLVFASTNWFMVFLAEFIGALPKAYVAPLSFVYTALLVCSSYFGSLFLLRRKVSKVDMVESLKGNRE